MEKEEEEEIIEDGLDTEIDLGDDDIGDDLDDGEEVDLDAPDDDKEAKSNQKFAEMRSENSDLKKTVEDLKNQVSNINVPPAPAPAPAPSSDASDPRNWTEAQWDELAKTDWKKAVDLRSEIKASDLISSSSRQTDFSTAQEKAKMQVVERHPELNDGASEKAKIYRNIVTANPEYLTQKKGPLIAMYEMEDYMEKNMGYKREDIIKAEKRGAESEAERQSRISLTSTKGRTSGPAGNKVKLSNDEVEFCKINEINPKTFATNKRRLETAGKGGLQL